MTNLDKPPLFHKAILESGAPTARAVYPYDHPLHHRQFDDFLSELGCSNISEEDLMSHLRTLPVSKIASASVKVFEKYSPSLRWAFQPVIDGPGGFISKAPIEAWCSGAYHKIPILTGFNTNEGAMFVPVNMSTSSQFRDFFSTLLPKLSRSDLDAIDEIYPESKYHETRPGLGAQFKRIEAAYAHWAYVAPVKQTVQFASTPNSESTRPKAPTYLYHFAVNTTVQGGANHGDQQAFVTYSPQVVSFSKAQEKIAGFMHAYWTSFIIDGDPNSVRGRWPDRPQWPAYRIDDGENMIFGDGNEEWIGGANEGVAAKVVPDTHARKECEFWWSKTDLSEQ
jgi:acetylcholinesterase